MSRRRERDRVRRKRAKAEIQESVTVIETIISEIIKCILMCTGILVFILVFSILMAFSNIITLVNQNSIWAMIWSVANFVAFLGVVFGLSKNVEDYLIPAIVLCPIAVTIGCINVIVNFVSLSIFG